MNKIKQFRNDLDSISYNIAMSKMWIGGILSTAHMGFESSLLNHGLFNKPRLYHSDMNSDMKLSTFENLYQAQKAQHVLGLVWTYFIDV